VTDAVDFIPDCCIVYIWVVCRDTAIII